MLIQLRVFLVWLQTMEKPPNLSIVATHLFKVAQYSVIMKMFCSSQTNMQIITLQPTSERNTAEIPSVSDTADGLAGSPTVLTDMCRL